MLSNEVDFFVIGAGSGGVRAARMAAQAGARVAVAEVSALGGTCVNLGCIPKKLYSYAAHYAEAFDEARGFGWDWQDLRFDWQRLKANRAREIERLNRVYEALLVNAGVTIIRGHARLAGPNEVLVDVGGQTQRWRAAHILIATGGKALMPEVAGGQHAVCSDAMFDLPQFPRRLVVVGAGYIACEMASIFNGLGADVTMVVRGNQLLRGFGDEIAHFLQAQMAHKGMHVRLQTRLQAIERCAQGLQVNVADNETLVADTVLYATGRGPNTADLGLDEVGVQLGDRGEVIVDDSYTPSVASIHAIGDVTDHVQLTPVALAEAMVLVDRLFGVGLRRMDYQFIPTAVFTHPNVGTVGWSEAQARERFGRLRIYRSEFKALKHTLSGQVDRTLMKLIVDDASDRVVGLHMVGDEAGEIVQGFAVAMKAGATKAQFDSTVGIHPTAAEEFVTMRQPTSSS